MTGIIFPVEFHEINSAFSVSFSDTSTGFNVDFGVIKKLPLNPYTGQYEFTPTSQDQIVLTKDKSLSSNITINKIPNNYGLITWNGSVLTVS